METIRLRQQATLATRPVKTHQPLAALRAEWTDRAERATGRPASELVTATVDGHSLESGRDGRGGRGLSNDVAGLPLAELAAGVVAGVAQRRPSWTTWNLTAEAARTLKTVRFEGLSERLAAVERLVVAAQARCVALHDPQVVAVSSGRLRWTSTEVLDAEAHLLTATADRSAPTVPIHRHDPAGLSGDQISALLTTAGSGRRLEVLVGSLGVPCENTAKWLYENGRRREAAAGR